MTKAILGFLNRKNDASNNNKSMEIDAAAAQSTDPDDSDATKDRFIVNRELFTTPRFIKAYPERVDKGPKLLANIKDVATQRCAPSRHCAKKTLTNRLPGIRLITRYRIVDNLFADLLAGFNVAIMHIPQGMAYSLLCTLSPIYGLYTSFYPNLIYWIFGTSRHISIGPVSVIALMTGSVVTSLEHKYVPPADFNRTEYNMKGNSSGLTYDPRLFLDDSPEKARIMIATATAFCIGIIQIFMFVFQLGFVSAFFSEPFNTGFITGCAVHVFTSQVKQVFGINIARYEGIFKIPKVFSLFLRATPTIFRISSANFFCCSFTQDIYRSIL
jgi:MFS superfamily sulfate permease-like transporter